jgi:hypothetical protein
MKREFRVIDENGDIKGINYTNTPIIIHLREQINVIENRLKDRNLKERRNVIETKLIELKNELSKLLLEGIEKEKNKL